MNATSAKNRFGEILRMAETEPVYIVKHGKPKTVVLGADLFEALTRQPRTSDDETIDALRKEFDRMYARMQEPRWSKGVRRLIEASSDQLNAVAARRIRTRAKTHR